MQLVLLVEFRVRPGFAGRFGELILANARASVAHERGCRRFDVLVEPEDGHRFVLYEVYDDETAFDQHLRSSHYTSFAAAVDGQIEERSVRRLGFYEPDAGSRDTDRASS
ncbi:MAG: antibiotic biosynthesis monooxygenase [Hyphomicrobiales bacterium]|nr:antibiotic biosynthesis monooxygenase [Hyphomicrobiales bacterium]MBV9588056.1 antibiotic biosynthesis monooxygenase [Hyphomicrobiales bacterium]MBV9978279.1 antibiotic biosynthesis monooxygenase [Hyphomicrobiales bacterium]